MRRFNFLEIVGIAALALPAVTGLGIAVLLANGSIRVYRETATERELRERKQR